MASSLSNPSFSTSFKTSSAIWPKDTCDGAFSFSFPLLAFALSSDAAAVVDDDAGVCASRPFDLDRAGCDSANRCEAPLNDVGSSIRCPGPLNGSVLRAPLLLALAALALGAGAMIACSSCSIGGLPLLLDLDFGGDAARSAGASSFLGLPLLLDLDFAGAAGSIGVSGACAAPLLRDLDFALAAFTDVVSGGSIPLPMDFAGPSDSARFGEGLVGIGCPGSIFGAEACARDADDALPILYMAALSASVCCFSIFFLMAFLSPPGSGGGCGVFAGTKT